MTNLPDPPSQAVVRRLAPGTQLWRIYFRGGGHPTTWCAFRSFGPTGVRFDHHLPAHGGGRCEQHRGILYAALNGRTCFAEVFQGTRMINRDTAEPWLVDPRRVLDRERERFTLQGPPLVAHDVQGAPEIDGLFSPSSMSGYAPALALYERAADVIPQRLVH